MQVKEVKAIIEAKKKKENNVLLSMTICFHSQHPCRRQFPELGQSNVSRYLPRTNDNKII